jgi:hypothetical protein
VRRDLAKLQNLGNLADFGLDRRGPSPLEPPNHNKWFPCRSRVHSVTPHKDSGHTHTSCVCSVFGVDTDPYRSSWRMMRREGACVGLRGDTATESEVHRAFQTPGSVIP